MTDSFGSPVNPDEIKSDERMLALFSHLSLFFGGILLPIIFWATNKDKSKFVTFHALQSLWFHVAYVVLIIILAVVVLVGGMGISLAFSGGSNDPPIFLFIAIIAFYAILFAFIFGGIGLSVYMGIKSYKGNFVKYPIIGKMVYNKVYASV
ncbi:MAG TPA: DUF4870 domain-containing protein [Ignavibacteria bacterium]|nr:DUF4870 domain-containing protein [Ignavibacteria bacterium]